MTTGWIRATTDVGEVTLPNRLDDAPGWTIEPDQVVVRVLDIADERNHAPLPVDQVVEDAQNSIPIGHPVERLRDRHRSELAEIGRQSSQIVRAADDE